MSASQALTVSIDTLGCKLNQAESEQLARDLRDAGCVIVSPEEKADIYILNTCTVTSAADVKARHLLTRARRRNPMGRIIATGCLAERSSKDLQGIRGVDLVVGNKGKEELRNTVLEYGAIPQAGPQLPRSYARTRSFLKIQDGCERRCAYCIVPLVRGKENSVPQEKILDMIRQREAEGYLEIVLTGTEVGSYREGRTDLTGLLQGILRKTRVPRLRISSLQPQELRLDLLELWQDGRLCPHFHISLQSGADSVLRRMGRGYTVKTYREALERLRSCLPDAAVTTDVIVAFPGETEIEFEESYEFCCQAGFARVHVFPFSAREGTAAARMPEQLASVLKKERSARMLQLAKAATKGFNSRFLGKTTSVLFERQANGLAEGLTGNYIRVYVATNEQLANQIRLVTITGIRGAAVTGELRSET